MKIIYTYMDYNKEINNINLSKNNSPIHDEIIQHIEDLGHSIQKIAYNVTRNWTQEGFDKGVNNVLVSIKNTDIFIGEMSYPSQTLGFMLAYAIQHGKPSLYLYPNKTLAKPASALIFNPSRLLSVKPYTHTNYKSIIKSFLQKAQKQLRSDRTTFVSTRYISDYLKWKAHHAGLSKGELIRGILENGIQNDPEYEDK